MNKCKAENCDREAYCKGYCDKHYLQILYHGKLTPEKEHNREVKTCKIEGCNNEHYGHGYCRKHYYQIKEHGHIYKSIYDPNDFIEKDTYYEMIIEKHNKKFTVLIDKEDFPTVTKHKWNIDTFGYVTSTINKKTCKLHRIIMRLQDKHLQVDHINGNKLDNRRQNLRICTNQQNNFNKGLYKHNTSGFTGVHWDKSCKRWIARIKINGKTINLGRSKDKNKAIELRKQAELKYFGEYSYLNRKENL